MIYSILQRIFKKQNKHKLVLVNEKPTIEQNAIYAVTHFCRHDFPYACQFIGERVYVLVGKQRLDIASRVGLILNGTIWVDRKDKLKKRKAMQSLFQVLQKGKNICIFPEGTWNMTQSKPILPLYWGIIELAKQSGNPIIPLALEYRGTNCFAQFGNAILVDKDADKAELIMQLEDELVRIKWEMWELFPVLHREQKLLEEWKEEMDFRIADFPALDLEYELSCVRKSYS